MIYEKGIAECVGLWLAEGDNKCQNEITFTNSCMSLVKHFDKNLRLIFNKYNPNIRIYVYSSKRENIRIPIKYCKINRYVDKRARKPYLIWRLSSVKLYMIWRNIVEEIKLDENYYPDILRGFFAGEGNIKTNKKSNVRVVRIAQGKPNKYTEKLLNKLKIAKKFKRDKSTICKILIQLKKDNLVNNYRVGSKDYWIKKDRNTVIISSIKNNYLNFLKSSEKRTKDFANKFNVKPLSSSKMLKRLKELGFVTRDKNKNWKINPIDKKVIII